MFLAGFFVLAGIIAAIFAPTETMGAEEAFFARLLLIAPPIFVATVVSALALIIHRLDLLASGTEAHMPAQAPYEPAFESRAHMASQKSSGFARDFADTSETVEVQETSFRIFTPQEPPERTYSSDFESLFAAEMSKEEEAQEASHSAKEKIPDIGANENAPRAESAFSHGSSSQRAPTVDEYLARGKEEGQGSGLRHVVREGQFAGRRYRMFEDGSLEIDTDQSTIKFASLDEFRAFVSKAGRQA